jgi:hypothetical protein
VIQFDVRDLGVVTRVLEGGLPEEWSSATLVFRAESTGSVTLEFDGPDDWEPALQVTTLEGTYAYANESWLGEGLTEEELADPEVVDDLVEQADVELLDYFDGSWRFTVVAGDHVVVDVAPLVGVTGTGDLKVSQPVTGVPGADVRSVLDVGESIDGVIEPFEYLEVVGVQLAAGEEVVLRIESPNAGAPLVTVLGPGDDYWDTEYLVGEGLGLYGFGTEATVEADEAGLYQVVIESSDVLAMYYRLRIDER